jgi:hypothetical protein
MASSGFCALIPWHDHARRLVELANLPVQSHLFQESTSLLLRLFAERAVLGTDPRADEYGNK